MEFLYLLVPNYLLNIDQNVKNILFIVLGILIFFTILFNTWRFFKKSDFVNLMLTRTYSWWIIFITYIFFFCIHPILGHVGLGLLAMKGFHEISQNHPKFSLSKRFLFLGYLIFIIQFIFSSSGNFIGTIITVPVIGFLIFTIYALLFEPLDSLMKATPFLIWSLLITSYGFSHLSYLLTLPKISGTTDTTGLFLYFIFLTQFNDVLQFIWGTAFGKHKISPSLSPNKTWEGFIGAVICSTLIGVGLRFLTPFEFYQALIIGFLMPILGFWGDLLISAFKRSYSLKDMGNLIPGHGGILDRIDSLLISSLVYFYLVYFWFY